MSKIKTKRFIFCLLPTLMAVIGVSCNAKSEEPETEVVVTPAIVSVKDFSLKPDKNVMENLDSVFFSIDLNTGVIFNADSLPKGTDVTKLIPNITFINTMSKADLVFLNEDKEEITVNYLTNPTDSIDFTNPVKLNVTAQNGINNFSYLIKVNVHKENPDTLIWTKLSHSDLPSRFTNPVSQKTVYFEDMAFCLIEEYNGEYTLSTSNDLNVGLWNKTEVTLPFVPDLSSISVADNSFWMLSESGDLNTSGDCISWSSTGQKWVSILGAYENTLLGIKDSGSDFIYTQYPLQPEFNESIVDDNFPIFNSTGLAEISTEWADNSSAIIACGRTATGSYSSDVWAFDGNNWAVINSSSLPQLLSPMMTRYVVFRDTQTLFNQTEFDVWLLFGGTGVDGAMNRTIYLSFDNGVNWRVAPEAMQLPEDWPSLSSADIVVAGYDLKADLSDAWILDSNTKTRATYTIEGTEITWVCPYLYVFGGYMPDNNLSTEIWRGVISKLTFIPKI